MPRRFPPAFLWGAATSSHQVEGDNRRNDWWQWEAREGAIHDGTRSGDACGWWAGRAEDDLALARELGHNAHRSSIEWSRLEPTEGRWDDGAFERYRAILGASRRLGLTNLVTLQHFTLPRWVAERGGWTWPDLVPRFARFSAEVARRLGDCIDLVATMNEPSVVTFMGYVGREWPPGLGRPTTGLGALARMLEGHAAAYAAYKRVRPSATIGIVLNMPVFDPARPRHPGDVLAARAQDWAFSGAVLHALETGRLVLPLSVVPRTAAGLRRSFDFLGLNYYGRYEVQFDLRSKGTPLGRHVQEPSIRTLHNDWGQIAPEGLTRQLLRLSALGAPLYVTENGIFDPDDSRRGDYLVSHVRAVHDAISAGADVRGYFHWSLLDNFEWAEGWSTPFGLVAFDRETGQRTPRPSAHLYRDICRDNALELADGTAAPAHGA